MKIGHGIFGWDGTERRSNRYGAFVLDKHPFQGEARAKVSWDHTAIQGHVGKRVRVTAAIVESRVSTHAGDAGLNIRPPAVAPTVGEVIDLGVGIFDTKDEVWEGVKITKIILRPNDGRPELWIDPRKLYVLHDQTVDVFVEETTDDFTEAPIIACKEGAFDNGDNSFQVKKRGAGHIPADFEKLGDGLFVITPPHSVPGAFGRRVPYKPNS